MKHLNEMLYKNGIFNWHGCKTDIPKTIHFAVAEVTFGAVRVCGIKRIIN